MPVHDLEALAGALVATAAKAGQAALRYYGDGVAVHYKDDRSPVTDADCAAEAVIVDDLARLAPDLPVIAEEAVAGGTVPPPASRFFLVDPLDGTKEFIKGNGEFTVNIALIDQGTPCFGLVYAPALSRLYVTLSPAHAVATRLAPSDRPAALDSLALEPLETSRPGDEGLVAAVSRSHLNEATERFLRDHGVTRTTTVGSSLKFCLLAEGRADVYPRFGPTCEWDTAAGHAILNAAGGVVLTGEGTPLRYGKTGSRYLNPGFVAWGRPPG